MFLTCIAIIDSVNLFSHVVLCSDVTLLACWLFVIVSGCSRSGIGIQSILILSFHIVVFRLFDWRKIES